MMEIKKRYTRIFNALVWLSLMPLPALADSGNNENNSDAVSTEAPSQALLEFLADFSGTDDLTFNVILYHGLEDYEKQQAESQDETESKPQGSEEP